MRARWSLAVLALTLGACRCPGGGLGQVDPGFRAATAELDFGRVLEGDSRALPLVLQATSRLDVEVEAQVDAPFAVPAVVTVLGGAEVTLTVTFLAQDVPAESTVRLTAQGVTLEVPVRGVGVRPPRCVPSAPCRVSRYLLDEDRCEESLAAEGAACQPQSDCLERGECRSGACVGVPRACDDGDACTVDGCAEGQGCVHTPRVCPAPTVPCRVATCDPTSGCGEAQAPDFTLCGTADCDAGSFCESGACRTLPTPDGFPCAPQTPCQPRGTCQAHVCERPDAGDLVPAFTLPLPAAPPSGGGGLVVAQGNAYAVLCGDGPWPGLDAGAADAGRACAVWSWTGTGFDRFAVPTQDGGARAVRMAGSGRGLVWGDGRLEVHAQAGGAALGALEPGGACGPLGVAQDGRGAYWVAAARDGGAALVRVDDAGVAELAPLPDGADVVALDELGDVWTWAPARGVLRRFLTADGGAEPDGTWDFADAGQAQLAVAAGVVAAGARWLLVPAPDAGWSVLDWPLAGDAGQPLEWSAGDVVLSGGTVAALHQRCDAPLASCAPLDRSTWVWVVDTRGFAPPWEAKVAPGGVASQVAAVALGRASLTVPPVSVDLVSTVLRVEHDAGVQSYLEVYAAGERAVLCRFPDGTAVEQAAFGDGRLLTFARRGDGGLRLEAWELTGLPATTSGWPVADGVAGTRRAR